MAQGSRKTAASILPLLTFCSPMFLPLIIPLPLSLILMFSGTDFQILLRYHKTSNKGKRKVLTILSARLDSRQKMTAIKEKMHHPLNCCRLLSMTTRAISCSHRPMKGNARIIESGKEEIKVTLEEIESAKKALYEAKEELDNAYRRLESTKVALMAAHRSTDNIVDSICHAIVKAEQSNLKVGINDEGVAQLDKRNNTAISAFKQTLDEFEKRIKEQFVHQQKELKRIRNIEEGAYFNGHTYAWMFGLAFISWAIIFVEITIWICIKLF